MSSTFSSVWSHLYYLLLCRLERCLTQLRRNFYNINIRFRITLENTEKKLTWFKTWFEMFLIKFL